MDSDAGRLDAASAVAAVRARLGQAGVRLFSNDSLGEHLGVADVAAIEADVAVKMRSVLDALLIDVDGDPNAARTAERVARMFVREVFAGRYDRRPKMVDFPNGKSLDELYVLGPIDVRSACAHHLCPVIGRLWVGVIPGERLIGISKFSRLARWIMARPQMQEEAVVQIADELERELRPRGLGVVIRARHSCMTWRGVCEHDTEMTSNVMRGILKESPASRYEFMQIVTSKGSSC